jgi:hypothetical protein
MTVRGLEPLAALAHDHFGVATAEADSSREA